jgi:hypothetical protein
MVQEAKSPVKNLVHIYIYIHDVKFLALLGAPYIYIHDISKLRVNIIGYVKKNEFVYILVEDQFLNNS